jgi:Tfp pilus assembly protein PilX
MSLLPALLALCAVMLAVAGAARMVRDGGLATAQHVDHQLAWVRAETALRRTATRFAQADALADDFAAADAAVTVEEVLSSDQGEIADLPLYLLRVTAAGESGRSRVRLQADYAIDGCEGAHDDPCTPRMRRIALRELPAE